MAAFERILVTGGAGFVGGAPLRRPGRGLSAGDAVAAAASRRTRRPSERFRRGRRRSARRSRDRRARLRACVPISSCISRVRRRSAGAARRRNDLAGEFSRLLRARRRRSPVTARTVAFLFASTRPVYGASFRDGVSERGRAAAAARRLQPLESRRRESARGSAGVRERGSLWRASGQSFRTGPAQPQLRSRLLRRADRRDRGGPRASRDLKVGDLSKARDFLDVRDVVDAYMRLIARRRNLPASRLDLQHRLRTAASPWSAARAPARDGRQGAI